MEIKAGRILVGAAIAGMISGGATLMSANSALAKSKKSKDVPCYGVNECGGKGACKTATNECGGKNSCKGKGMLKMSKKACAKKGGSTEMPPAEKT